MMKFIWGGLIVIGLIVGIANGKLQEMNTAILQSAGDAAELSLSMIGIYALWLGLLNVGQDSGMIEALSRKLGGFIRLLFVGVKKNSAALGKITLNIVANMLGMGNAATPFGLEAMREMQSENPDKKLPTHDMCIFLILNTASVQLLPLTIIAVRAAAGSSNPSEILPTAIATTFVTALFGWTLARICARVSEKKR